MIDDLKGLAIFCKVVESGSFAGAARGLGIQQATVSERISSLEATVGVPLFYRSTRRMSVTAEGQLLQRHAMRMLEAAEHGLDAVRGVSSKKFGRLRINMPSIMIKSALMTRIAEFSIANRGIDLQISFSDRRVDLIKEGFDLALRIGNLRASNLKARKLFAFGRKLVAAPSLVESMTRARQLKDMEGWPWIGVEMRSHDRRFCKGSKQASIKFQPQIVVDSVEAAYQLAREGSGVTTPPDFLVEDDLESGELIELFPTWKLDDMKVYAIWPEQASIQSLSRLFINHLTR